MISLYANLQIARRAMQQHQLAMSVIGTNIANVNTPGYSRRRPVMSTGVDIDTGYGLVGAGAEVTDIRRARDTVLDSLFRRHRGEAGKWAARQDNLTRVETILNEPAGGLSETMGAFWASWQDLANEPENASVRAEVRMRAEQLTATFHRLDNSLKGFQQSLTTQIGDTVDEINSISARLAEINVAVVRAEAGGHHASGLRDERDLLLDELSEIVNISVDEETDGSVMVHLGSQVLVQKGTGRQLESVAGNDGRPYSTRLVWENTDHEAVIGGGLLRGYLASRDENIQDAIDDLDQLAAALVSRVNGVHSGGYGLNGGTGRNFFDPDRVTAADIGIDTGILDNLDYIAASAGGQVGDGQNALAVSDLSAAMTMSNGTVTFDTFYNTLVARVGLDASEATSLMEAEEILAVDIESQRLSVSGVSLDEEMSYLLSYQHAYEAMVQVANTIDEMLDTLIVALG